MSLSEHGIFDLTGRVVVITGASGKLGREYVRHFSGAGAKVAALDVTPPEEPSLATWVCADVTDIPSIGLARDKIVAELGHPDVLVNNAALDFPPALPIAGEAASSVADDPHWVEVLEVNLGGVLNCCRVFGRDMAECGSGSIINICSIYGMVAPDPALYSHLAQNGSIFIKPISYVATKSALPNMTAHLAVNMIQHGVRVNTLTLGGVLGDQDSEFIRKYCERVPSGRMAQANDYFGALTFLASDASRYVVGANVVVDGGWTAI